MTKSQELARLIRISALKMVTKAKSSHIGPALSMADIIAVLYAEIMRFDASNPSWSSRDRFILSKGHACTAVYAALAAVGFFDEAELDSYGENGSRLMAHISHKVPGVEFSTGSLGHGLPFAVGKALALRMQDSSSRVYVVVGDGELDEGSNWEALLFASHHKLDNLTLIVDRNNLQSFTTTEGTLNLSPLDKKFESFGCEVSEVNGHDHGVLRSALARPGAGKPKAVIAQTIKGKGVSFMENSIKWHYTPPTQDQLAAAIREIEGAA